MQQLHVTQFSGEELQKRFDNLEKKLQEIQKNFEPKLPTEFISRQETADLLKVNLSTIHNYTKQNKLKAYGIGHRVYYKRSEIEEALIQINE